MLDWKLDFAGLPDEGCRIRTGLPSSLRVRRKILSSCRGISYVDAKKMVHRRCQYEKEGRLNELSLNLFTDPFISRGKPAAARRLKKNEKPSAAAFLERERERKRQKQA